MATRTRTIRSLISVAAAATLLVSCGVSGGNDDSDEAGGDAGDPTAETTTTEGGSTETAPPNEPVEEYGTDQCPTAAEVGELLGTEVDQMPWGGSGFGGDITTTSSGCSYSPPDAESFFDDQITISRLSTDAPLSKRLFDVLDEAALADADENGFRRLDDLGDGAALDGREVVVRTGDALLWVEVEPEGGAEPGSDNPAIALAEAALSLEPTADATPTCDEVEALVADEVGPVEDSIPHSSYTGFDDLEISADGCAVTTTDATTVTIAVSDATNWEAWLANNEDSMFNTSYTSLEVLGRKAFDDANRLVVDDGTTEAGDAPFEIETASTTLDEPAQAVLRIALAELAITG